MRLLDLGNLGRSVSHTLFPCCRLRNRRSECAGRARKGQLYEAIFKGTGSMRMDCIKKQTTAVVLKSLNSGSKQMC